jgi:glycosyltransferase involved in cell wall biosynthesis
MVGTGPGSARARCKTPFQVSRVAKKRLISIISPCFNEELGVTECHQAVKRVFEGPLAAYDWEHIFADNCSTDGTVGVLRNLASQDARVKIIINARNYGPFRSIFNALKRSSGDAVLVMLAVDLQDPPEALPEFVARWEQGFKVVYGVRRNRKESILMRAARTAFYRLVAASSDLRIPKDAGEFQLVDRQVVQALARYQDYYPYIRGMIANVGFRSTAVPIDWGVRKHGRSHNNLMHLYDQAINGLISFANLPMRLCVFLGLFFAAASLVYAAVAFFYALLSTHPVAPQGTMTLIVAAFFFGGVQLFFIGVIGEYVAAIHSQVRQGFVVVEEELVNFAAPLPGAAQGPA